MPKNLIRRILGASLLTVCLNSMAADFSFISGVLRGMADTGMRFKEMQQTQPQGQQNPNEHPSANENDANWNQWVERTISQDNVSFPLSNDLKRKIVARINAARSAIQDNKNGAIVAKNIIQSVWDEEAPHLVNDYYRVVEAQYLLSRPAYRTNPDLYKLFDANLKLLDQNPITASGGYIDKLNHAHQLTLNSLKPTKNNSRKAVASEPDEPFVLQIRDEDIVVFHQYAFALRTTKRNVDAIEVYRALLPVSYDLRINLEYADALLETDNIQGALAVLSEIRNPPLNYRLWALNDTCWAYDQLKEFNSALEPCRQAIFAAPNFWNAWDSLGVAYEGLGRFDDAEMAYKRTLELNPDAEVTKMRLTRLGLRSTNNKPTENQK